MTSTLTDKLTLLTDSVCLQDRTVAAVAGLLAQAGPDEVVLVWGDRADLFHVDEMPAFLDASVSVVSVVRP